jgi:hypothetical protein
MNVKKATGRRYEVWRMQNAAKKEGGRGEEKRRGW